MPDGMYAYRMMSYIIEDEGIDGPDLVGVFLKTNKFIHSSNALP